MNNENLDNSMCQECQQLVAWYPTSSLSDAERRQVEEHAGGCAECSKLLEFASDFKNKLVATAASHPAADSLVAYAENCDGMEPSERAAVEVHLGVCGECQSEVEMLETVDQEDPAKENVEMRSRQTSGRQADGMGSAHRPGFGDAKPSWWDILTGAAFRPAAAAVYLAIAVVAVGLLVSKLDPGETSGVGDLGGVLNGVTILGDESGAVRAVDSKSSITTIDSGKVCFLLLELTELDTPPAPGDEYVVRITRDGAPDASFKKTIDGAEFSDNYTLCVFLQHGVLDPGEYDVDVIRADGDRVFRSTLIVE